MPELAERHAASISAARQQLELSRDSLNRCRNDELAEAEVLSLARIKADAERALAHQAQTLRDAERSAERAAIERRAAELEVIKEAQHRQQLEQESAAAAVARSKAERLAEQAAQERKSMLAITQQVQQERLSAEREALAASRSHCRARIGLAWITLRTAPPLLIGLTSLLAGVGSGWLIAGLRSNTQGIVASAETSITTEAPLRLETRLGVNAELSVQPSAQATQSENPARAALR